MPLEPDDTVCFCFHVSLRKIETFCRTQKPQAASEISECLSAGTGCGWCVPMLRHLHKRLCGQYAPWWRQTFDQPIPTASSSNDPANARAADPTNNPARSDDSIDPASYKSARAEYLRATKIKPPPGAEL